MPTHQGPNSAGSPQVWEGKVVCIAMGVAGLIHNYSFELTEEGTSFGGMTGMTAVTAPQPLLLPFPCSVSVICEQSFLGGFVSGNHGNLTASIAMDSSLIPYHFGTLGWGR